MGEQQIGEKTKPLKIQLLDTKKEQDQKVLLKEF